MTRTTAPEEALSPTSLDPQETSQEPFIESDTVVDDPLDLQSTQQRVAHRHHEGPRRRTIYALWASPDDQLRKRARRLAACCCCPTFRTSLSTPIGVSLARCRDRLCPLCSRRRGHQATAKVLCIARSFDAPRLITLTLKATADSLKERLFHLFQRFGLLRTKAGWSSRVKGGVWTLEITRHPQLGHWHAHLHIIADGAFFPQPVLKELWHQVTGDSYIVDVRAIHDRSEAARYVAGYLGKPIDVAGWPAEAIQEFATATHGRRLMQPFGSARKVDLDADTDDPPNEPFEFVCSAHVLQAACVAGYGPALRAREVLARMSVDHAIAAGMAPPTLSGTAAPVEDWEMQATLECLKLLQLHTPQMPPEHVHAKPGSTAFDERLL
jgi:hypothetical protein